MSDESFDDKYESSWINEVEAGVVIKVAARPGAKKSEVVDIFDGHLRVKISGKAVDGEANRVLIGFLAKTFHTRPKNVEILKGYKGRVKQVLLKDLQQTEIIGYIWKALGR